MLPKLFIIVRSDLPGGQQAVQGAHALTEYIEDWSHRYKEWYRDSNTLAFLSVPDE